MRNLIKLVILIISAIIILFNQNVYIDNFKINPNNLYADTLDNPSEQQIFNARDLSSSFNERGYLKSNSASYDGKEVINDYNGNLMYKIPLSSAKGQGDLAYEFSLNYNGNINYQVINSSVTGVNSVSGKLYQYNVSAPGWIFSLNGLAVQMLNFESSYFTKGFSNNEATGKNVHLLASGYQLTDLLTTTTPTGTVKDKITIMLGDGSTEVLENTQLSKYTGWYKSTSKNSFIKAWVRYMPCPSSCDSNGIYEAGFPRIMYLMKGDGLTYIYEEWSLKYLDHEMQQGMAPWFYPMTFLLTKVKDRFGHVYELQYMNSNTSTGDKFGRPWLTTYPGGIIMYYELWGGYAKMMVNTPDGYYSIYPETFGTYSDNNHRPNLKKIINPIGETMSFEYEYYNRKGIHLYNSISTNGEHNMTIKMGFGNHALYRLKKVTNFDGGIRNYDYLTPVSEMTMDYELPNLSSFIHSDENYYLGQGRDYFFSNMLSSTSVEENEIVIRSESFSYGYNHSTRTWSDVWSIPVDSRDDITTTRTVSTGNESFLNNTPSSFTTIRNYKNYRIKETQSAWQTADYEGQIKLVTEAYSTAAGPYKTIIHDYYKGFAAGSEVYSGTFLDSMLQESYNGVTRQWTYSYVGGGDIPITQKVETDPLGLVTTTKDSVFTKDNYKVFESSSFNPLGNMYDSTYLYLIGQPYEITVTKNNILLQKKIIEHYNPSSVVENIVDGYPGQVSKEINVSPLDPGYKQEIRYVYYNQDTTGRVMYSQYGTFASENEGKIKEITDANGNKTKYYYYLISRSEDENPEIIQGDEIFDSPRLRYHVLKGSLDTEELGNWNNLCFPSRIDKYLNSTQYISNYQLYDIMGNPTAVLSPERYLSTFDYGFHYRLNTATLPGDFDNTQNDVHDSIIETLVPAQIISNAINWGTRDDNSPQNYYLGSEPGYASNFYSWIIYDDIDPDNPANPKYNAICELNTSNFNNIASIDSAFVDFSPYYIEYKENGELSDNYKIRVKAITTLGMYTYATAGNYYSYPVSGISNSTNCGNAEEIFNVYADNHQKLDITSLLNSRLSNGTLQLIGLQFDIVHSSIAVPQSYEAKMKFKICTSMSDLDWQNYSKPVVTIYSSKILKDTIKIRKYHSGTLIYDYNDANNKVSIFSKIDKPSSVNRNKVVEHLFDNFGKLKETHSFYGAGTNDYNTFKTYYNYLDQKSKSVDARNLETKFSYDVYGNLSQTKYADDSSTLVSSTYQSSLWTNYYNISNGFINKQVFTDETGRSFVKYSDAVGNLLREIKYVEREEDIDPDNPFNMDTTSNPAYGDNPPRETELITDYQYDSLYRVINVKTPGGKTISYTYDAFGRQSSRNTPDAGTTQYKYDKNGNLIYSQDANQAAIANNIFTYRKYDAFNRLLTLGVTRLGQGVITFDELDPDDPEEYDNFGDSLLLVNVYDTVSSAILPVFNNLPSGYSGKMKTLGNLVATAYRTRISEAWNYKYYKYDARSRVIRMWSTIVGLGTKVIDYSYNSQNQATTEVYQSGVNGEFKKFWYQYDDAARLKDVSYYTGNQINGDSIPEEGGDTPGDYTNLSRYIYNENSQIDSFNLNNNTLKIKHIYNNRNWLLNTVNNQNIFRYALLYNANGNPRILHIDGSYDDNFEDNSNYRQNFVYDKSNRLLISKMYTSADTNKNKVVNTYDYDGNIKLLKRYSVNNNLADNFNYEYFSGTNKLKKVVNLGYDQYTYDVNGNMTNDLLQGNRNIAYDHRNLMTQFSVLYGDTTVTTVYYYDESGNRIRKTVTKYFPEGGGGGDTPPQVLNDEFYVRDISGKEIAIYDKTSGTASLIQWNIWGIDNIGKLTPDGYKYFYLKDHLGSIRATVDQNNNLVSAQDYDAWGYPMENRSWQSRSYTINNMYKFTSKERDDESNYDYFGARYYDSRIANWTSKDPLFEKHIDWTPYNYVLRNPLILFDPDGKAPTGGPYGDYVSQQAQEQHNAVEEIRSRISDFVGNVLSGDIGGAFNSTADALNNSLRLGNALMPTNPAFDMVMPMSVVGSGEKLMSSLSSSFKISERVAEKIAKRNITGEMVKETIKKGEMFWDPKNQSVSFVSKDFFSKGKNLLVGKTFSNAIKTAYPTDKISKRLIKLSVTEGVEKIIRGF